MSLIIATGTNLGNRKSYLDEATKKLQKQFTLITSSNIYESDPVEYLEQPRFLNQVHEFQIPHLTPEATLTILKQIELEMGRKKTIPKGPRIIDLDIIFWGKTELSSQDLTIPHPKALERSFVVLPLMELPFFKKIKNSFNFPTKFETGASTYKGK